MSSAITAPAKKRLRSQRSKDESGGEETTDNSCESEESNSSDDENEIVDPSPSRDEVEFNGNLAKFKKKEKARWPVTLKQYDEDPDLGEWVFRMRRDKQTLVLEQFEKLNSIDFYWMGPQAHFECSKNFDETTTTITGGQKDTGNSQTSQNQRTVRTESKKRKGRHYRSQVRKQGKGPRLKARSERWNRNFEKLKRWCLLLPQTS